MNMLTRQVKWNLEGFSPKDLRLILNNDAPSYAPSFDSIIFDSIVLSNKCTIKCIQNYYALADGSFIKKKEQCLKVKKFFELRSTPYDCDRCHLRMLDQLSQGIVIRKDNPKKK